MAKKNTANKSKAKEVDESVNKTTSTPFSSIDSSQIEKLRDAFQLIDQDNDGIISREDVYKIYESIGEVKDKREIEKMFENNKEQGISFTDYLSIMTKQLTQLPSSSEITRALQVFSKDFEISASELKESLLSTGMKASEIDAVLEKFKTERMNGDQVFMGKEFLNYISS